MCLCMCVFVCGTPAGRLARSDGPKCSRRPTAWHQSMSKALTHANTLLIAWWRKHIGHDGTCALQGTWPSRDRRRRSGWKRNTSGGTVKDRRLRSMIVETHLSCSKYTMICLLKWEMSERWRRRCHRRWHQVWDLT